jgi:putative hydrolase of the HAD superfamily
MRCVFFDIDDTVYDQFLPFRSAFKGVFGHRFDALHLKRLFVCSRARSDEVFEMVARGELTKSEMYAYRIRRAFEDCGASLSREDGLAFQAAYAVEQQKIALLPDMVRIFDHLQAKGVPMGIISNGPEAHQMRKVRTLGLERWIAPAHFLISGEVGAAKPATAIFREAERRLGVPPKACTYIGDAYAIDVVGAKRAGWRAIWLNRRENAIPDDAVYFPDHEVKNEGALARLLLK